MSEPEPVALSTEGESAPSVEDDESPTSPVDDESPPPLADDGTGSVVQL